MGLNNIVFSQIKNPVNKSLLTGFFESGTSYFTSKVIFTFTLNSETVSPVTTALCSFT
ncbi:hypothetical protein SAMN02745246_01696 [Leeuwenhoekiella marinoflava DSM 3653]|uniref:Uncharacterized protein n=2 Tax=Leeuwenhoekiella marinoflava TaxID=988 RepID=A0A4Q0PMI4_9FLAO|nr:hypothetical protein DSL99_1485 [Leeuwenhoekiella marinoflava]SHF09313.1 hypothetical protein SAMN02745246_01696 [Leeuwenhoekiella marinoflava DSM 3653]